MAGYPTVGKLLIIDAGPKNRASSKVGQLPNEASLLESGELWISNRVILWKYIRYES